MYQHKDHLGNVRLSYADVDGNHTINPVTEILEVNNYYPFGLQHTGYGHIDNNHRSEEAEQYKFLNKEYENTYNLNVIETDFRQYDPALGRFVTIDLLSELAPNCTPYRYGFNNPNIFTDPTGLFESVQTALEFAESLGYNNYNISYSSELKGYVVTVIGGQFNGDQFYNFSALLENIDINVKGSSGGSGGGGSNEGHLKSWESIYSQLPDDKFTVYFFETDSYPSTQEDWELLLSDTNKIHIKNVTLEELRENNYTISYP